MRLGIMYLGKSGGICQYTYELAKAMCPTTDLTLFVASQNALLEEFKSLPCNVRVIELERGFKSILKSVIIGGEAKRAASEILQASPDIVLDTGSAGWCNATMKWLARKTATAAVIHDVYPHPSLRHIIDTLPTFACPLAADAAVLLSGVACRQALKRYPRKARIESKHGIIHGVENVVIDGIVANRKKLLFFGNIDAYKGVDYLVDAFAVAKKNMPDLSLTIAGNGEISKRAMRKIKASEINLINRYITDEEVRALFASHGLLVLPYTSATQSGVAAAALANGLPTVATNTGALPEQIIDGVNGKIVPPADSQALADAIIEMVEDENKFRQMAEAALKLGQTVYSWETIAERLLDDLNKLAQSKKENC